MEIVPFILRAEEELSGNIANGEIIGRLSDVAPPVELALAFIAMESERRALGHQWHYTYITKIALPFVLTQSGPGHTIALEAYPGSLQTVLTTAKGPLSAKIGQELKNAELSNISDIIKETHQYLKNPETLRLALRGLLNQEASTKISTFILRSSEIEPGNLIPELKYVAMLDPQVDNRLSLEISGQYNQITTQVKTTIEQYEQLRDYYRETTEDYLLKIEQNIAIEKRKLAKDVENLKVLVGEEVNRLNTDRRNKLYNAEQERTENAIAAVKRLIPVLTNIQNSTIEVHNRLDLERNKLMERTFDPKRAYEEMHVMENDLGRALNNLTANQGAILPKLKEIAEIMKKNDEQNGVTRNKSEEEYQTEVKFQEQRPKQLVDEVNQKIAKLQKCVDEVKSTLEEVLQKIDGLKQEVLEQQRFILDHSVDPQIFKVKKAIEILYIPIYVAKLQTDTEGDLPPETKYLFFGPGVWDPQGKKQPRNLPVPNLLLSSMSDLFIERIKKASETMSTLLKHVDTVSQKYNLTVNLDAEEHLVTGLKYLAEKEIILITSVEKLKNTWFQAARLCSHCGAEVVTRKGFCNVCGKSILIRSSDLK